MCVYGGAYLHWTAWVPKPLYCIYIGCLWPVPCISVGIGSVQRKKKRMKGMPPYKYFSNINLYPNASLCAKRNRTLRHSLMNTVFLWKVAFNKYLFLIRREIKIQKQHKNPREHRLAENTNSSAFLSHIRGYCSGGQFCRAAVLISVTTPGY